MRRPLLLLGLPIFWWASLSAQTSASVPAEAFVASRTGEPGAVQQKRALALEDYYRVRSVGSPDISPNGQWVAYTVSLPIEETNGTETQVWIVRADGSAQPVLVRHEGQVEAHQLVVGPGELEGLLARADFLRDAVQLVIEDIAQALGEDEREDVVLELGRILRAANGTGCIPDPGFEGFVVTVGHSCFLRFREVFISVPATKSRMASAA